MLSKMICQLQSSILHKVGQIVQLSQNGHLISVFIHLTIFTSEMKNYLYKINYKHETNLSTIQN